MRLGRYSLLLAGGIGLFLAASSPAAGQESSEALLNTVRQAWEARQAAIRSAKFSWTLRVTDPKGVFDVVAPMYAKAGQTSPPTDTTHDDSGTLIIDGSKTRLKTEEKLWNMELKSYGTRTTESAFDGKLLTMIYWSSNQPFPGGIRGKSNRNEYCATHGIWPLLAYCRGTDADMMSRQRLASFTQARRSSLGGQPTVELTRTRNETEGEAKLWVDPNLGYALIRRDEYTYDGGLFRQITITAYGGQNEWHVPRVWKVLVYQKDRLISTVVGTLKECELNPSVPASEFRIVFPAGTRIEERTDKSEQEYLILDGDKMREILPGESNLSNEQLLVTKPGELVGLQSMNGWWERNGLSAVTAVVFILAPAIFLVCRWYRQRRQFAA